MNFRNLVAIGLNAAGVEGKQIVKLAGITSRAIALLSPLLFAAACTTQSVSGLDDGMGMQPQASFAATAPNSESLANTSEQTTALAQPATEAEQQALAPAFAKPDNAEPDSSQKLAQVASLQPASLEAGLGEPLAEPAVFRPEPVARRAANYRFSSRDHECLARAMFFESNRSSRDGLVAVGSVVMNRLDSGRWGDSVCGVVGAPRQFAPGVLSRRMDSRALPDVMEAAASVLKGERHPKIYKDVMFFHTAGYRFNYNNMHYVAVAGGNSFYEKRRRMRGQRNTPQNVVMASAQRWSAASLTKPVKAAFVRPAKSVRKMLSADPAPENPDIVEIIPIAAPRADAIAPTPAEPATANYVGAPAARFVTVSGAKAGRVMRKPSIQR